MCSNCRGNALRFWFEPEEQKEHMKRKHSERLKDKIAGFMLLGGFILLLAVTIGGQL